MNKGLEHISVKNKFSHGHILQKLLCLVSFAMLFATGYSASYNPDNIPFPKKGVYPMYTSNPDHILTEESVQHIERMLYALEDSAGVKTLVVVVERIDGDDPHQFNLQTMNKYGVGDAKTNRGLMITLATLDRSYYISTGYGLESELPDAICKRVGYRVVEPRAKIGNFNEAITAAVDTLCSILTHDSLTVESFSQYDYCRSIENETSTKEELSPVEEFLFSMIAYALALFFMGMGLRFVLYLPNCLYLHNHKTKEVFIKNPSKLTGFWLDCVDSFWNTGNKYYYMNEKGKKTYYNVAGIPWLAIFLYILSALLSGGRGGGGGRSGGSSHGSGGGGRSGGGGAGGRF